MDTQLGAVMPPLRQLVPHWNTGMVAASVAISLLGAFTSTQLMCQARASRTLSGALVWSMLGSLTFGFCAVWCLHFVAMLACELDVPIGLNFPLTMLSAFLAVFFSFGAMSGDLIRKRYRRARRKNNHGRRRRPGFIGSRFNSDEVFRRSSEALLQPSHHEFSRKGSQLQNFEIVQTSINGKPKTGDLGQDQIGSSSKHDLTYDAATNGTVTNDIISTDEHRFDSHTNTPPLLPFSSKHQKTPPALDIYENTDEYEDTSDYHASSTEESYSRRSSSISESDASTLGLSSLMDVKIYKRSGVRAKNLLAFTTTSLYQGMTRVTLLRGFVWSLAITGMHYFGIFALEIPHGYFTLNPWLVALSAIISWVFSCVGIISISEMEVNFPQQLLFSAVTTSGVVAKHFTGMSATTFWSLDPPSPNGKRGYPPGITIAVVSIAILTCMGASGLLAHSATVARNKLAEVVYTRKRLWAAIAQKENAEAAAAARSEFIASASHEIRTPLHQLQGYSDLLSRTQMTEEGRLLLLAIQHATKSLSMITSNVLDWSRLEKGEAICRPVAVDVRLACEAIINLLPNRDEEVETDLLVVVAPEVPLSVFVDETYLHRIFMNLLSNAFKFTISGYVLLLIEVKDDVLYATVKDTGFGIPHSFLPQLFEPFKQAQIRGAQRGTGLGLSIIKQLLQRMQGDITVESKYQQEEDIGPANSGSAFTVTIPVSILEDTPQSPALLDPFRPRQITIMHDSKDRDLEGLTTAWTIFGSDVVHTQDITAIPNTPDGIIWADLNFLRKHKTLRLQLLRQHQQMVLIPYDNQTLSDDIIGSSPPKNIVLIRKPLIWHRIIRTIVEARNHQHRPRPDKNVRFAQNVDFVESQEKETILPSLVKKKRTVLLVEDNKINQKLGAKMLNTLNYDVLIAEDGQEAIEIVMKHDDVIDAILMDQSMPRKDGNMATREIRAMESAGSLSRRRPIIAVTAVVGPEAQQLCMEAGTDAFLPKPLALVRLEQTLVKYLDG